ncbi:MAG: hypothetical protein VX015_05315 [Planctomycetota bacterium]|nr:hypothetical protein [Planctomycetota bacterium]
MVTEELAVRAAVVGAVDAGHEGAGAEDVLASPALSQRPATDDLLAAKHPGPGVFGGDGGAVLVHRERLGEQDRTAGADRVAVAVGVLPTATGAEAAQPARG